MIGNHKTQITKHKQIPNSNIQNSKRNHGVCNRLFGTFGDWNLIAICNLRIVICYAVMALLLGGEVRATDGMKKSSLTDNQIKQLRTLVGGAQKKAKRIQNAMQNKQQELAKLYANFDLEVSKVEKLQREILDLQQKLLRNYHDMHVQLRSIVSREQFVTLQKRIDLIFGMGKKKPTKTNGK